MNDLYFAEPQWIHGLWVVLLFLCTMIWLERRGGGDLSLFVSKVLQPRLVRSASLSRRMIRVCLLSLAGVFMVISLMRPQWGLQFISTPKVGAEIMVCLDVSKSMLAEDVAPNRLGRAKAELGDLLTYLQGDQVGLIAFAGRASVLSPLTPDFGFLRLVLDNAGPHSVTRGGTRLEEPIRKAIEGFGDTADVSRSILLITDGEDQDSFPIEAAKAAAERGIRILSIGFGSETGSEIMITDRKTGARQLLRDSDGNVVRTRLDGEMLREIALITEGAYIPAGTGVLDLKSIYDAHIAGLTRGTMDGEGRTVRNDAYQFTLILALLFLVAAVVSTVGGAPTAQQLRNRAAGYVNLNLLFVIVVAALALVASPSFAEDGQSNEDASEMEVIADSAQNKTGDAETDRAPAKEEIVDPRLMYNEGLSLFDRGQWDAAAKMLQKARTKANTDGELRYNATYNLGWVEVKKADSLLEKEPEQALKALYAAADWYREAISLRSDKDARYNLEVVLSRALILADDINKKEPGDLLKQMNITIKSQRAFLNNLREGVDLKAASEQSNSTELVRRTMRSMATQQLEVLSESQQLTESAGQEIDALNGKLEEEKTPEDKIRVSQLEGVLSYLHKSQERMGQARRRMRTLQVERAYRRAATALSELKRGRDQLLDPVTRIDALLGDGMELMKQTGTKAAEGGSFGLQSKNHVPAWLTEKFLAETQQSIDERAEELHLGLSAGLEQESEKPQETDNQTMDPKQAQMLANLREAVPFLGQARQEFGSAVMELESSNIDAALKHQQQGLKLLTEARELFLDIRQLIELVYQDEMRIQQYVLGQINGANGESIPQHEIIEYLPLTAEMQDKNLKRVPRIGNMISTQLFELIDKKEQAQQASQTPGQAPIPGQPSVPQPGAEQASLEQLESEEKRLKEADQLQLQLQSEFREARDKLQEAATGSFGDEAVAMAQARTSVVKAKETVETLRRLFFSIIDHLKETARKQMELSDETNDVVTLADTNSADVTASKMGPLSSVQQSLGVTSGAIADALLKQADSMEQNPPAQQQQGQGQDPQEKIQNYRDAASLVTEAQSDMNKAVDAMASESESITNETAYHKIASKQQTATERLVEAIKLLEPPQEKQDQDQDQEQQEQDQQEQEQGEPEEAQESQERGDYDEMLQGVRDREKKRRDEKEEKRQHGYEPVEKDW